MIISNVPPVLSIPIARRYYALDQHDLIGRSYAIPLVCGNPSEGLCTLLPARILIWWAPGHQGTKVKELKEKEKEKEKERNTERQPRPLGSIQRVPLIFFTNVIFILRLISGD